MTDSAIGQRSHVSGFVKKIKEHTAHGTITCRVLGEEFVLPKKSTFGEMLLDAHKRHQNVLVLFTTGKKHPLIVNIIVAPTWHQVVTASKGE